MHITESCQHTNTQTVKHTHRYTDTHVQRETHRQTLVGYNTNTNHSHVETKVEKRLSVSRS